MPQDDEEKWYFWGLWKYDEKSLEYGNQWNTSHHISWATVEPQPNPTHIFENRKSLTQGSSAFDDLIYLSWDYLWSARCLVGFQGSSYPQWKKQIISLQRGWGHPRCRGALRPSAPGATVPSIPWNRSPVFGSHVTWHHFRDPMKQVVIFWIPWRRLPFLGYHGTCYLSWGL